MVAVFTSTSNSLMERGVQGREWVVSWHGLYQGPRRVLEAVLKLFWLGQFGSRVSGSRPFRRRHHEEGY